MGCGAREMEIADQRTKTGWFVVGSTGLKGEGGWQGGPWCSGGCLGMDRDLGRLCGQGALPRKGRWLIMIRVVWVCVVTDIAQQVVHVVVAASHGPVCRVLIGRWHGVAGNDWTRGGARERELVGAFLGI